MSKKTKILITLANSIITLSSFLGMIFLLPKLEWYLKIIVYLLIGVFGLGCYAFLLLEKQKLAKSLFVSNVVLFAILALFFMLNIFGIFEKLSDMEYIKSVIIASGSLGIIVCVIIQLIQVVILPAPAFIFYLAISAIYGSLVGFTICYLSTILGSVIAYLIGRKFGRPVVDWCIGKQEAEKYTKLLCNKGKIPFLVMQILPFFPDDVLCMVAGVGKMSFKFFILVVILVRPIYIAFVCFLGRGNIIPFSGWGIPFWIGVFIIIISSCIVYFRKQEKIDIFIKNLLEKRK